MIREEKKNNNMLDETDLVVKEIIEEINVSLKKKKLNRVHSQPIVGGYKSYTVKLEEEKKTNTKPQPPFTKKQLWENLRHENSKNSKNSKNSIDNSYINESPINYKIYSKNMPVNQYMVLNKQQSPSPKKNIESINLNNNYINLNISKEISKLKDNENQEVKDKLFFDNYDSFWKGPYISMDKLENNNVNNPNNANNHNNSNSNRIIDQSEYDIFCKKYIKNKNKVYDKYRNKSVCLLDDFYDTKDSSRMYKGKKEGKNSYMENSSINDIKSKYNLIIYF